MTSRQRYSVLDRAVHRIAFLSRNVQRAAAGLEGTVFRSELDAVLLEKPVFIASVPRSGTTLLLEILSGIPDFASHRYRDMPFALAPLLWDSIIGRLRESDQLVERAQGDGVMIGYDSPEALDEVLWLAFWPEKYSADGIRLWSPEEERVGFHHAFARHMRRVIAARRRAGRGNRPRYLSKNNTNLARLGLLRALAPDARIVVPFRAPLEQARSMLRQHLRFRDLHARDPFARRYMADLGHFEFGALHRPIEYPGLTEVREHLHPAQIEYWLRYWTLAFEHLLSHHQEGTLLFSYERLCSGDRATLNDLSDHLEASRETLADAARERARPPRSPGTGARAVDDRVLGQAASVHEELLARSAI